MIHTIRVPVAFSVGLEGVVKGKVDPHVRVVAEKWYGYFKDNES